MFFFRAINEDRIKINQILFLNACPSKMTRWILVTHDARIQTKDVPQRDAHKHMGGPLTFVGAIPSLNAVVLSRLDSENLPVHEWNGYNFFFSDLTVRGCIAIVSSSEDGDEQDLDVNEFLSLLGDRVQSQIGSVNDEQE